MSIVVVISSHVARGYVGNAGTTMALQRLGHEVWPVPTVMMAHHPGHGPVSMLRTPAHDLARMLAELGGVEHLARVGAVLSGYLAHEDQAGVVAQFVNTLKAANPAALYCCDPVLGDDGALYVPQAIAQAIKTQLLPLADILTPNLFELGWLAGRDLSKGGDAAGCARSLGAGMVVASSCQAMLRSSIATMLVTAAGAWMAETQMLKTVPKGTGDLLAALFLGHLLNGVSREKALEHSVAGVFQVLLQSVTAGRDELDLVAALDSLGRPLAMVRMRRLGLIPAQEPPRG